MLRAMMSIARLSKEPALAEYFALVHPFFWWVFVWQMRLAARHLKAAGRTGALIRISWWGGVRIEYLGDPKPNPSAYRPVEPTRRAWDDPVWSSAIPAGLLPGAHPLFFARLRGGFEGSAFALQMPREGAKGACTLTSIADTS